MQSRINELCDRQYGFELDKRTDVDAADVGGIMLVIQLKPRIKRMNLRITCATAQVVSLSILQR
jgi:hypothetical protein